MANVVYRPHLAKVSAQTSLYPASPFPAKLVTLTTFSNELISIRALDVVDHRSGLSRCRIREARRFHRGLDRPGWRWFPVDADLRRKDRACLPLAGRVDKHHRLRAVSMFTASSPSTGSQAQGHCPLLQLL